MYQDVTLDTPPRQEVRAHPVLLTTIVAHLLLFARLAELEPLLRTLLLPRAIKDTTCRSSMTEFLKVTFSELTMIISKSFSFSSLCFHFNVDAFVLVVIHRALRNPPLYEFTLPFL